MNKLILILLISPYLSWGQDGVQPIIDVHVHGYTQERYPSPPGAPPSYEAFKNEVRGYFKKYNIVAAVKSGGEYDADIELIMLPGLEVFGKPKMDTTEFRIQIESGKIKVFGEINAQFAGLSISDASYAPYLAICEKYGIPVAIHTGNGPPGIAYRGNENYRLSLGDPYLVEDILIKYPKLKVYIMHAGMQYFERTLALMDSYPQVYCDLGVLLWVPGMSVVWVEEFLKKAKRGDFIDRIMYGSDGMYWPDSIEKSILKLDSFDFLTVEDKRKIFYHNAVRFFELDYLIN